MIDVKSSRLYSTFQGIKSAGHIVQNQP